MNDQHDTLRAVVWREDKLHLIDQRKLPHEQTTIVLETASEVAQAIQDMVVRGAPAIGITAAYGVVFAAKKAYLDHPKHWQLAIEDDMQRLMQSRPTAVNLAWALQKMRSYFASVVGDPVPLLLKEAQGIQQQDIDANHHMGEQGAMLLSPGTCVLTHCNAGALATGGYGTALGVIRSAFAKGKIAQVYADETRPWWQGSRLTAWELQQDHIPVTLITDSAAAFLMRQKRIHWVIVGADRITAQGDVANKIGTYSLAVLARQHHVKFMVVAPTSTLDMTLTEAKQIVIEERSPQEVLMIGGQPLAPLGISAWNPVFDVTPAELVDVLVTEKGIVENPTATRLSALMNHP